jgi:PilZ domain
MISYLTSLMALVALGSPSSILREPARIFPMEEASITMDGSERRQLTRYNIRTPLRFRAINLTADKSDHFTEALNVSRGGFYFASSAPLQIGTPIEATLRMPAEVTGTEAKETKCTARVVHVKNQPYGDGRIGFGAESEKFHNAVVQERGIN